MVEKSCFSSTIQFGDSLCILQMHNVHNLLKDSNSPQINKCQEYKVIANEEYIWILFFNNSTVKAHVHYSCILHIRAASFSQD